MYIKILVSSMNMLAKQLNTASALKMIFVGFTLQC